MLGERTMSVVAHPSVPDHASLVLLEAEDLHLVTHPGRTADLTPLHGISFTVRDGEIFGIAGVEGNGQTALELILAGLLEPSSGRLLLRRSRKAASLDTVASSEQKSRRNLDLGYIPSDRARFGVVASLTVQENLLLPRLAHASGLQPSPIQGVTAAETADLIGAFRIEPPNPRLMVSQLSGGNMQKVVLARELSRNPLVTVAAQPTAGLDVGAASMFRTRLREHANAGAGVVLISSDLDELLEVADKIAVMYRGRLSQPWARSQFDVQAIGAAMAGGVTG
jgi:simple sugar transport system ATP-binding protein